MEKHIQLPLTEELAKTLHAGDSVLLSGIIYTSRDAGHKRMCEALARGEKLPFDPTDATIYYVGPTPAKPGQVIGSAGPTTSGRMDAYAPTMMSVGARGMIGKEAIYKMKDGVNILNFARGELVDDLAIKEGLATQKVKHYVTDFPNKNVAGLDGVITIPHLGASTEESEDNCAEMAVEQLMNFLENGNITHSVNFPDCDMGALVMPARVVVLHKNIPAMVSKISQNLGEQGINIETMNNRSKGEMAVSILDVSAVPHAETLQKLEETEGIIRVRLIQK